MRQAPAIRPRSFESRGRWSHGAAGQDGAPWCVFGRAGPCREGRAVGQAAVPGRQEKRARRIPAGLWNATGGRRRKRFVPRAHSSLMRVSIFRAVFFHARQQGGAGKSQQAGRLRTVAPALAQGLAHHGPAHDVHAGVEGRRIAGPEAGRDDAGQAALFVVVRYASRSRASSTGASPSWWKPFPVPTGSGVRPGQGRYRRCR